MGQKTPESQPSLTGNTHIDRAAPPDRDAALSLLLTGSATPIDRQAVSRFQQHVEEQQIDARELWLAKIADQARISTLIVPNPGRTAMIFLSAMVERMLTPTAARLVKNACQAQNPQVVALVQALLDPGQQLERLTLLDAGFTELAQLIYMQRAVNNEPPSQDIDQTLQMLPYTPDRHDLFCAAIEQSYIDTLDCPGLVGLRHTRDIIAGHMAAGQFTPDNWFVLADDQQAPAGVMLFNDVPHQQAMELVYLGLAPAWRGKKLGRQLMLHALHLAAARNISQMLLAVDDNNQPAMRLYKSLGFKPTARKLAMIFALSK